MMKDPFVTCVLLTADRPAMTMRAVKSFLAQTYERKALLIFDSGLISAEGFSPSDVRKSALAAQQWRYVNARYYRGEAIGALRNAANECAAGHIIAHWDSDDWSHPYRLAEQVNLLQTSRADAVGYHDMLFWSRPAFQEGFSSQIKSMGIKSNQLDYIESLTCSSSPGEAHLYRYSPARDAHKYALGTSLLYWRRTWERVTFDDPGLARAQADRAGAGEDNRWIKKINCVSESSIDDDLEPCMIAEIHGGNLVQRPGDLAGDNFERACHWDGYCRDRMILE